MKTFLLLSSLLLITSCVSRQLSEGIKIGTPYLDAKSTLLKQGWKLVLDDQGISDEFPEISCGQGVNAICSVGFVKGDRNLAFVLDMEGERYLISGEY